MMLTAEWRMEDGVQGNARARRLSCCFCLICVGVFPKWLFFIEIIPLFQFDGIAGAVLE
jgi:hypothetical protein